MTRTKSQAHQLRKAASLGLVHNPSAVDLDRAIADPKLARDRFVREPSDQPVHDLSLPKRQGGKAVCGRLRRWIGARLTASLLQGVPEAGEQSLALKRLFQEVGYACLHGLNGKAYVGMTRDDDERHGDAAPGQLLLELKPIHLRHADISHKAISCQAARAVQKLDSRCIGL